MIAETVAFIIVSSTISLYFLPTIIASWKKSKEIWIILILNMFCWIPLIGQIMWVILFVKALFDKTKED